MLISNNSITITKLLFYIILFNNLLINMVLINKHELILWLLSEIIILVLFLLSQIPQWLVRFLHFGGALFLFYLAIGSYQSWKNFNDEMPAQVRNEKQTLLKATFVNILNPAPYLGWSLVMGPLFLKGYHESPINGIALLISFYITLILCLAGIIFLFAFSRRLGPRVSKNLIGLSVIALIGFGIYQLWMGIISW